MVIQSFGPVLPCGLTETEIASGGTVGFVWFDPLSYFDGDAPQEVDTPEVPRGAEQVPEQRDQHHQHEAVEHRGEEGDHESGTQQPPVRPHQPEQATLGLHLQPWRGVSRAMGSMTSSGDTPPWRNAPR